MRVVQWNVWYREDIARVWETLRALEPDVVCLQELTAGGNHNGGRDTFLYLQEQSGWDGHVGVAQRTRKPDGSMGFQMNGILTRLPVVARREMFVQDEGDLDPKVGYDAEGRLYVEVAVEYRGQVWQVGTVHMSYTDGFVVTPAKQRETRRLVEEVGPYRQRYILTGDLNVEPGSFTLQELERVLVHAGPDYAVKSWTTKPFSYRGFEATTLDWRLDYAFVSRDVKVQRAEMVDTPYSDHLPLVVEVEA